MGEKFKHTPEPWTFRKIDDKTFSINGGLAILKDPRYMVSEVNAKRIVTCVNACEGLNENQLKYLAQNIREGNEARRAVAHLNKKLENALAYIESEQVAIRELLNLNENEAVPPLSVVIKSFINQSKIK